MIQLNPNDLVMLRDDSPEHWWTVTWVGKTNFTCALCPGDEFDVQASPNYEDVLMVAKFSDPEFEKWSQGMLEYAGWHRSEKQE